MCGINGIFRLAPGASPLEREKLRAELLATRDAMAIRGPDGAGEWLAPDGRAALGHRRLAILDLSPTGAQPMASADGRFHIVLNGEIYNFRELRRTREREGVRFRSTSDTEVILALYARHGAGMLPHLRGMFALAIWDESEKTLLLARDALGIKPLYYALEGRVESGTLRFASQVKALERSGAVPLTVDPAGLAGFLLWGSVPEPWTIRAAIKALPAGSYLLARQGKLDGPRRWYRFGQGPQGARLPVAEALADSVRAHLVSDVPVAVFLSAGLDSSLLAALACRALPEPPATFTLSFDTLQGSSQKAQLDEAPLAAEVARRLGTRHVEGRVGREEFLSLWDEALSVMDQPSIDGFNTFLVSRAAHRAGFKVVLSGLGGDEVFGSYPSFVDVPRAARLGSWGRWARRVPGLAAAWTSAAAAWPQAAARLAPGRPKLAGLLSYCGSLAGSYFLRRGLFLPEELPALLGQDAAQAGYDAVADAAAGLAEANGQGVDPWLAVHAMETAQYMRNQLLRDSDWAAMASSLELRVPLVDAELREHLLAARFEPARNAGKAALVRSVAPELPAALWSRPKTGFYAPVVEWLEGEECAPRAAGGRSRRLALRVLAGFGIETANLGGIAAAALTPATTAAGGGRA